ncbi:MAG: hypothetical protein O2809_10715 [Proteobacteria bacterium]|nr:hypothetical protein [Pseudomonadota bacterium]
MITKKLAKAKMENLAVRLRFIDKTHLICKVVKLLGTEIEVMVNNTERRTIQVNSLVGVYFKDEYIDELA